MKKIVIVLCFFLFSFIAFAQGTFTTFVIGFTMSGGQPFYSAPRSIVQMPDSSYRLFASYKQNISSNYRNGIVTVAKNGVYDSGSVLNANPCYLGHGYGQLRSYNRNYFLYVQPAEYCSDYQTISKITLNGDSIWQRGYTDVLNYPEPLRGDSFGVYKGNSFVIYNANGDSLKAISGKPYTSVTPISGGNYLCRESGQWVVLDRLLNEVSRKSDSVVGITGSVASFEYLPNGKIVALVKENCVYDAVLLSWWCTYSLIRINQLWQVERHDSLSYSIHNKSTPLLKHLSDGGILAVVPESRYDIKLVKIRNDAIEYSFVVNNNVTNKAFGIWGDEFHAYELMRTNDNGMLLVIDKENGTYNHTTMLMKFDSVGNFYWPFATGQKEIPALLHSVYPNPVTDELFFELHEPGQYTLTVTNANGQVVYQNTVRDKVKLETPQWSRGVYFYHLNSGSKTSTGKFVKM